MEFFKNHKVLWNSGQKSRQFKIVKFQSFQYFQHIWLKEVLGFVDFSSRSKNSGRKSRLIIIGNWKLMSPSWKSQIIASISSISSTIGLKTFCQNSVRKNRYLQLLLWIIGDLLYTPYKVTNLSWKVPNLASISSTFSLKKFMAFVDFSGNLVWTYFTQATALLGIRRNPEKYFVMKKQWCVRKICRQ